MLVVDASAIVDLILDLPPHAARIEQRLRSEPVWAAPHLLDAEVASVLRNRVLRGKLRSAGALAALADFVALPIERFPHTALLPRAFELRDNASLYDALYLALAEALDARLRRSRRRRGSSPRQQANFDRRGRALAPQPPFDIRAASTHVLRMSKMIQIRHVPDGVHQALKARAAKEGMSLSDFLRREVARVAGTLTLEEAIERARRRDPVELDEDPAITIRQLRGPLP